MIGISLEPSVHEGMDVHFRLMVLDDDRNIPRTFIQQRLDVHFWMVLDDDRDVPRTFIHEGMDVHFRLVVLDDDRDVPRTFIHEGILVN